MSAFRSTALALIIAVALSVTAWAGETAAIANSTGEVYGLTDLFRIGIDRAEGVQRAEESVNIAKGDVRRARSVLAPTLSAFGAYTQYSETKSTPLGSIQQPEHTMAYGLRFDQSFSLSGRELIAFRVAKMGVSAQGYNLTAARETLLLDIASAYYDVLMARRALEIATSNVERLTKHRDEAAVRVRVGEAARNTLLRAEAELSSARASQIKAGHAVEIARQALAAVSGVTQPFDIVEPPAEEFTEPMELAALKEAAVTNRAEVKALDVSAESATAQVKYAKGAYWPTVTLAAVWQRMDQDPTPASYNDESMYATVQLSMPLVDWGRRRAEVAQARSAARQAELTRDEAKKNIQIAVERAWRDYLSAQGVMQSFEDEVSSARENFTFVSKQFEHGLATNTDVMDANTLLVTAEQNLADAIYSLRLARLRIKRESGTLSTMLASSPALTEAPSNAR